MLSIDAYCSNQNQENKQNQKPKTPKNQSHSSPLQEAEQEILRTDAYCSNRNNLAYARFSRLSDARSVFRRL